MIDNEIVTVIGQIYVLDVLSLTPITKSAFCIFNNLSNWREGIAEEFFRFVVFVVSRTLSQCLYAVFYCITASFLSGYLPKLIFM